LGRISHKDSYAAPVGEPGGANSMTGADGNDFVLKLPIGAVVTNTDRNLEYELLADGERIKVLRGGSGGLGNEHFKSSTNQTPRQATKGKEGEKGAFTVELKLIADIGLVGLPNAGKTSLLNALTHAGARVGDYPFTTLDPNLGVYHGYVIADLPGLIEGAAEGKGLGHKFLRHISRTSVIIQCISLERDNILDDYEIIRGELDADPALLGKGRHVLFTKTDTISDADFSNVKSKFIQKYTDEVSVLGSVTVLDDESVAAIGSKIASLLHQESLEEQ
jgi:GTP-binding protein